MDLSLCGSLLDPMDVLIEKVLWSKAELALGVSLFSSDSFIQPSSTALDGLVCADGGIWGRDNLAVSKESGSGVAMVVVVRYFDGDGHQQCFRGAIKV